MRMIHLPGATHVSDPVHGEATAGPDGVFDLPHPFAEHLLKTAAGTWRAEHDHIALLARQELDELRDPKVALNVLSDLCGRVKLLEAEVAELRGAGAAAATPDGETQTAATPEPELTPAQKAAATRAAKKAEQAATPADA